MNIVRDTRDKVNKHHNVDNYLVEQGHKLIRTKMYVGDVQVFENSMRCIDLKQNLGEVYSNVVQQHDRFVAECERAKEFGIELIVLVEEENIKRLDEVRFWNNPRYVKWCRFNRLHQQGKALNVHIPKKPPMSSQALMTAMQTISEKHGVKWAFAPHDEMGKAVEDILINGLQSD